MKQQSKASTNRHSAPIDKDTKSRAAKIIAALKLDVKEATSHKVEEVNPLMECFNG